MWFLVCPNDGFSDVTSGTGTIVVGLSAVIIAEVLIHDLTIGGACYPSESVLLFTV